MNFYTTILGSGAALPTVARHCSGQVVNINGFRILLDCGENTQTQLRVYHQRMQAISQIFITHLHGDHFFGLPGLVSSMHLCGRKEPLDVYAPAGVRAAMELLMQTSGSHLAATLSRRNPVARTPCAATPIAPTRATPRVSCPILRG